MQENAMALMNEFDKGKKEDILFLAKQGIDVFNLSDRFYNDLCYFYKSPNNKDICMKDRISYFFPNISLCEPGCKNKGVNLDNLRVKCECIFNDFMDNELIGSELGQSLGEIVKIIDSLNIEVIKCIKYIFDNKRIKKCTGGLIFTCLFVIKIIFIIFYLNNGMNKIKQYIFLLYESFNIYLGKVKIRNEINFPPKKVKTKSQIKSKSSVFHLKKTNKNKKNFIQSKENKILNNYNSKLSIKPTKNISNLYSNEKMLNYIDIENNINFFNNINNTIALEKSNEYLKKIDTMLNPLFDETDLDEVIENDKRTFSQYFCENLKHTQILINTFFVSENLRPRTLKIILLILTLELYFTVNALFYNEDYLSELFHTNKKEKIYSFIPRRLNHFVYISLVNGIISYLFGFFSENEENLERIFKKIKRGKSDKAEINDIY